MDFSFLWENLTAITWQQLVMYVVGAVLIWLAIEKGFEPALLMPSDSHHHLSAHNPDIFYAVHPNY